MTSPFVADIDWNARWRAARARRTWQGKTKDDWNQRAAGFAKRNCASGYTVEFIRRLPLRPEMTVLDMGAGPGTLALPLAKKVKRVTAVDFSPEMLSHLSARCQREGIANIDIVHGAWEDDWAALGIGRYDLAIASRSLSVDDLRAALIKLNAAARERVVIGDRVGPGPFDPALFAAVGRDFVAGPDYIYTVNLLYQLGIQAEVQFIDLPEPKRYESREAAIDACAWMLHQLTPAEQESLDRYFATVLTPNPDGTWSMAGQTPPRWAMISFAPRPELRPPSQ